MTAKPLDEEALFHAARRIADPDARALFLNQACGDDAVLAERVRTLLKMHEQEFDELEEFEGQEGGSRSPRQVESQVGRKPGFARHTAGAKNQATREALGDKFPKHVYHSIVCIGALVAYREAERWAVDASARRTAVSAPRKNL